MEWLPGSSASLLVLPEHRRFLGLMRHTPSPHSEICVVQPYIHFPPSSSNREDLEAAWDFDWGSNSSSSSSSAEGSDAEIAAASKRKRISQQQSRKKKELSLHNHLSVKTQWQPIRDLRRLQEAPRSAWLSPQEAEMQRPGNTHSWTSRFLSLRQSLFFSQSASPLFSLFIITGLHAAFFLFRLSFSLQRRHCSRSRLLLRTWVAAMSKTFKGSGSSRCFTLHISEEKHSISPLAVFLLNFFF